MQSLNILVVGQGYCIKDIKNSKYINKIYSTSEEEAEGIITVQFNTFKQLAQICKALQVDIVLVEEEKWVLEGITSVLKQNLVNCFAVTPLWTNLKLSHNYARNLLEKYQINLPPQINLPVEFPVVVKADGFLKIANSIQEIVSIKEEVYKQSAEISKTVFIEKYLNGEKIKVTSVFDGKNLITFPNNKINNSLLQEYSKKLETMLIKEKADFIGFFNSELIEENDILYNTGFDFGFTMPDLSLLKNPTTHDILFICLLALYQKLNEIDL